MRIEMNRSTKLAEYILDYWFAIEFLSQEKYPKKFEIQNMVKKYKQKVKLGKGERKCIETFIPVTETNVSRSIYEIVKQETNECGMHLWGNLTFYIGMIKRERCIESIANVVASNLCHDNPEKTSDSIAVVSLQLSPEGKYLEDSLSLSSVIWALKAVKHKNTNLSEVISSGSYQLSVKELETRQFDEDKMLKKSENEEEVQVLGNETQCFAVEAVTWENLENLYEDIYNIYIKENIECHNDEDLQEVYGISFQMFSDSETRNASENEYLGLNHDYFSNDIKMVLNKLKSGNLENDSHMGRDLIDYIEILDKSIDDRKRINLVKPQSEKELYESLSEILAIQNAPLGKWPTRHMPALMQQVAINFAVNKGLTPIFGINGNIFSVNGPPGTGKTTLLKEIVVNNIVERAILLAEYKNPNDAFCAHKFKQGTKEEGAYSSYTRKWHSLINDDINNYSMLVTSCNNAAVENISKELPQSMIGDLKPLDDDTQEHRELLSGVSDLFDLNAIELNETTRDGNKYSDIYFSNYTSKLLQNENTWGLIAAPLGKKSNIKNFYFNILNPLLYESYRSNQLIDERQKRYKCSREAFLLQLKEVERLREEITKVQIAHDVMHNACVAYREIEISNNSDIHIKQSSMDGICDAISSIDNRMDIKNQELHAVSEEIKKRNIESEKLQKQVDEITGFVKQLYEKKIEICGKTSIFTKIFKRSKHEAIIKFANEYDTDIFNQKKNQEFLNSEIAKFDGIINGLCKSYDHIKSELDKDGIGKAEQKTIFNQLEKEIQVLQNQTIAVKQDYKSAKAKYDNMVVLLRNKNKLDQYDIFDEEYVCNIMADDNGIATKVQVQNPWFFQRYNRERERLFAYAMEMNKDFVLSSKACRDNFKTLSQYWRVRGGDDNQKIEFKNEDVKAMLPSLFQTLFLLVPVISSTFASVGSLFKDIKNTGVIGLLVVDEAGQAQPQMAVGALYRSRRAMVVGDPKQVEPVVTDDLNLFKELYNADGVDNYKPKNLSVQVFADRLNSFGTFLDNSSDYPEWVGSPLLVHRRCISPMYDISNKLSYDGIMKLQTGAPKKELEQLFILDASYWINIQGNEKGNKNHFVDEQGHAVCKLLEKAFERCKEPDIYIISPFTTVVDGVKDYIKNYSSMNQNTKIDYDYIAGHEVKRIGTVHTFQGKEAKEVIFLLGCDNTDTSKGAIGWVNDNIVNVAVTRAKYRLYVVGDEEAWEQSACVSLVRKHLKIYN